MISDHDLVAMVARLEHADLHRWVALGWISAAHSPHGLVFDEVAAARVHLICDLVYDIEIDEEGMPVILSLLDQLHDARRLLRAMGAAIDTLPESTRQQIAAAVATDLRRQA